jgi:hypothetical protein
VPAAQIGAYLYFRAQPGLGLCQGGPVIFRGLDNAALLDAAYHDYRSTMPWPTIRGNTITTAAGYRIEWVLPGHLARLTYTSPDRSTSFDLEQQAISPLLARGHVIPGENDHHDTDDAGSGRAPGGSEQFMHVTGTLTLRGETFDVDCYNVRDRSWNQIRTEDPGGAQPIPPLGWTPICFGADLAFNTTSIELPDTSPAWAKFYDLPKGFDPSVYSWVVVDGEPLRLTHVRRNVHEYHPVLLAATKQEIDAEDERGGRYHFLGEAIAMNPVHSWPNIGFCDSVYRWTADDGRVTHCTYQEIFYDLYVQGMRAKARARRPSGRP